MRRESSVVILAAIGIVASSGLEPATAAEAGKPNVVVLLADDMGFADVGFEGCRDIPTPRIDALAAGGVRFSNGYVSGPYCSPTRAGLLTGRYQQRFGHEFNGSGQGFGLPTSETTIADRFKAAGYATAKVAGAKKLEFEAKGKVRTFGVALENPAGIVVDNFGIVSVNVKSFGNHDPAFFAGDSERAKQTAKALIESLGFTAVDAGPLKNARYLEPLAALNIYLGYGAGLGTSIAPTWISKA